MLRLFRLADFWNREPLENSAERIDRALLDRTRRLSIGLHVDQQFKTVSGSLVVCRGRGKSIRVLHCESLSEEIPQVVRDNYSGLLTGEAPSIDVQNCIAELADVESKVVDRLKLKAAKYVDRILAISVIDPGIWRNDFDGSISYSSLCDATRLAEQTGISVIDAWPDRDLAVGGKGAPLDPLCMWLLQADRDRRIARFANVSIHVADQTRGYLLPPSDGLDAEVPKLRQLTTEGLRLINGLIDVASIGSLSSPKVRALLVSGIHSKALFAQWDQIDAAESDPTQRMLDMVTSAENSSLTTEQLLCTAMSWISKKCESHITQMLVSLESDYAQKRIELQQKISKSKGRRTSDTSLMAAFDESLPEFRRPGSIMVDAPNAISDALVSRLQNRFSQSQVMNCWQTLLNRDSGTPSQLQIDGQSLMAALLGFMHVDQMPANVPALTGANQQRILGRLTPGRPNSWRHLLREMADHEPSAMKLRDAI